MEVFQAEERRRVAVAFINAYANPEHELAAERALREFGFEGEISLSHQVSGEYREYERTTTTVIDAYVRRRMASVPAAARGAASRRSASTGNLLVTRSGGGVDDVRRGGGAALRDDHLRARSPAPRAPPNWPASFELGDVITADVGGTSFDTCLIPDGRPQSSMKARSSACRSRRSWVDVRSIGAGGGSIAYVDVGGLLRVGPRSAGADPGPGLLRPRRDAAHGDRRRLRARHARRGKARRRRQPRRRRRARCPGAARRGARLRGRGSRTRSDDDRGREHGERDPRDHGRAGAGPAPCDADGRSAAPARCSARCSPASSRSPRSSFLPTPATSRPGACSAPTSPRPRRARGSRSSPARPSRVRTRSSPSCSPTWRRAPRMGPARRRGKSGSTCATPVRSTRSPSPCPRATAPSQSRPRRCMSCSRATTSGPSR